MFCLGVGAKAYDVVNLPEAMPFDEAFSIFDSSDITKATISNYADRKYIELSREQIDALFEKLRSVTLTRHINPMPFRGTALNLHSGDGSVKSYYVTSGIQLGLFGDSNYITYSADGEDAVLMTEIETLYQESQNKIGGDIIYRTADNDFLKMPSDSWAKIPIEEAAAHNLIPYEFVHKYQNNITREEFCILLSNMIKVIGNYASMADYMADKGINYAGNTFSDCADRDSSIYMLNAMGIVSGRENNTFDPDGSITREEAAAMITRTAQKYISVRFQGRLNFSDSADISYWAGNYVSWVSNESIMNGSEGMFMPKEKYTVLQAITTVNRLYKVIKRNNPML